MKLLELTGIKHLKNKNASEILRWLDSQVMSGKSDLEVIGNGANGIAMRLGNYVYKFWYQDSGYEQFIRYCLDNPGGSFLPKIHGNRIRKLPLNMGLHSQGTIKYVKLDLLEELDGEREMVCFGIEIPHPHDTTIPIEVILDVLTLRRPKLDSYLSFIEPLIAELGTKFETDAGLLYWRQQIIDVGDDIGSLLDDELNQLCMRLYDIAKLTNGQTFLDIHLGNVMQNERGDLVILDPLANNSDIELNSLIFRSLEEFFGG